MNKFLNDQQIDLQEFKSLISDISIDSNTDL